MTEASEGPLRGVRVLDLTRLLPGNYCTWLLAALGADVVKVEDPGAGDYMRDFGFRVDGQSASHHLVNRAKRSIVLDLKQEAGRQAFLRLVETADAVVDSFRPGVLDRLGLGYEGLRAARPSLVCLSISGFGADGPLSGIAAHDLNYLAFAGHLHGNAVGRQAPVVPPVPWADLVGGGLLPALSAMALLLRARDTGQGGVVDGAIAEGVALLPHILVADALAGAGTPAPGTGEWTGGLACYRVYEASGCHVAVGAVEPRFWRVLCEELGLPDLVDDQFVAARQEHVRERLQAVLAGLTRAEIEERFGALDACLTVVGTYDDFLAAEHTRARGLVREDPDLPMPVLAPPFRFDGARPPERGPAPRQGEHTAAVLREAGFREAEVQELLAARAAVQA